MRGTLRDQFRGQHPFFWVVVIAAGYAAVVLAFHCVLLYKYAGMEKLGYPLVFQLRITEVFPNGPATGKLQAGDVIVGLNGMPATLSDLFQLYFRPIGTDYTMEIERNGIRQQVALRLERHTTAVTSAQRQSQFANVLILLGLLLVAIFAGLLRPTDPTVRHFFVAFYAAGVLDLLLPGALLGNEVERQLALAQLSLISRFSLAGVLFHFFLRFPPGIRMSRFWEGVKWWFYGFGLFLHTIFVLTFWDLIRLPSFFAVLSQLFGMSVFIAVIAVTIRNYRQVREPQQRQRIKWILGSTAISLGFFLIGLIYGTWVMPRIRDRIGFETAMGIYVVLNFIGQLVFVGSLAAWTYAILKHRVLDINVVIRRSLRYLLASRGFILIEALLAFALLSFVFAGRLGVWLDRFGSNTRTLITILGTVLMVLALQSVNRKIRPQIDRRFFRDAYDAQQILTELGSSLRTTTNVNEVLELTTAKIQQALYAANVTIFLRNGQHDFQSAVSSDYHEREKSSRTMTRDLHLPEAAFVVQRIHDSAQPAEIDWDDPYSPVATQLAAMANGDAAAQQEFETLRELKTNLVLPLAAKDELLGVLALGPRAGDLPYSREDKRMLMNVAGQTAMALENSRLIEQKIDLEAENERRAHELEEARQLQLSMLPKKLPNLPHLDIAAFMKPATEVGGDYYDFHVSEDGTLTIAVGDATGHGLKAGTMVTATKSLFNETNGDEAPVALLHRCSRALKAMNLRGLFMALTVAKVKDHRLTLAAAGMPPILLCRAVTQTIEEILHKTMPLGSLSKYTYKEQELSLAPGDVVVMMSDGLPERFNAAGEMLGYETMQMILQDAATLSAADIIQQFVARGEAWADGKAQDDDVTFVVLKVR